MINILNNSQINIVTENIIEVNKNNTIANDDSIIMRKVLELAKNGIGKVEPNPYVGAIIVRNIVDDANAVDSVEIIAEGFHNQFGGDHAEVVAIKNSENLYPNLDYSVCTIYVNLEPCSHFGKTPPCADLLIKKGFKKVVIAMTDPNPLVSGNGIEKLKNAGIEVVNNVLSAEAKILNQNFTNSFK